MQRHVRCGVAPCGENGERAEGAPEKGKARGPEERRSPFLGKILLMASIALAPALKAGCTSDAPHEDAEDVAADAELDSELEAGEADGPEAEEDGAAEDTGPEEADAGPDEADAGEETEADADETSDSPVEDGSAEDAGCERVFREELEEAPMPDVGDPASGGSTQAQVSHQIVSEYVGEECEGAVGSTALDEVEYRFSPSLGDFEAAVKLGILTANLGETPDFRVVRAEAACIVTARVYDGARIGIGMPASEISDDRYLVVFSTVGETSGSKWVDISIWDLRRGTWVRDERVTEGSTFALPNGRRGMPTGIDVPGHTVRMDILEPEDIPLCDGEVVVRESDGMRFVFWRNLPDGWAFPRER